MKTCFVKGLSNGRKTCTDRRFMGRNGSFTDEDPCAVESEDILENVVLFGADRLREII